MIHKLNSDLFFPSVSSKSGFSLTTKSGDRCGILVSYTYCFLKILSYWVPIRLVRLSYPLWTRSLRRMCSRYITQPSQYTAQLWINRYNMMLIYFYIGWVYVKIKKVPTKIYFGEMARNLISEENIRNKFENCFIEYDFSG